MYALDIIKRLDIKSEFEKRIINNFENIYTTVLNNINEKTQDGILNLDTQRTGELIGRMAIKGTMTDLFSPTIGTLLTVIMFLIANKKEGRKRSNLK